LLPVHISEPSKGRLMPLTIHTDKLIGQEMALGLAEVEARFAAELVSELDCVNQLVTHLEHYRGKMFRPMMVLATCMTVGGHEQAPGPISDAHLGISTVVEMVHMATLVHDDILDEAEIRRRGITINSLNGNETAVMLGDYLISHAYHLCSNLDESWLAQRIACTTNTVCEGELLQLANRNNWKLDEETYFEIIRRKTASLCGACCGIAAQLCGVSSEMVDQMNQYGEQLGIAFQIVDDVLDLIGDQDTVGKTLGRDLQKGKLTLPLIHFLETSPIAQRDQLLALVDSISRMDGSDLDAGVKEVADASKEIKNLVVASQAMEYSRHRAQRLIDSAMECLESVPSNSAKELMQKMALAVINRES
jgi:octaprenyl-diphosphate synthase